MTAESRIIPSIPAMIIQGEKRHLIVSDLHLGFEDILDANDIFIGEGTVRDIISEISGLVRRQEPDTLVLLGDTRSGTGPITRREWDEIPRFFKEINGIVETIAVPGNHDANMQRLVPPETTTAGPSGIVLENILLTHGHVMPSERFGYVDGIIMGHLHPVFLMEGSVLNGRRVWISMRVPRETVFPSRSGTIQVTVTPAFNRHLRANGRRRRARSTSPIIERIRKRASARIVTLDGAIVGDASMLGAIL